MLELVFNYQDMLNRGKLLTSKLLSQVYCRGQLVSILNKKFMMLNLRVPIASKKEVGETRNVSNTYAPPAQCLESDGTLINVQQVKVTYICFEVKPLTRILHEHIFIIIRAMSPWPLLRHGPCMKQTALTYNLKSTHVGYTCWLDTNGFH